MRELQKRGLDLNPEFDYRDMMLEGVTMLECAAIGGSVAAMRLVLDAGTDMAGRLEDRSGSVLSVAASKGHEDVVRLLLEEVAKVQNGYCLGALKGALREAAGRNKIGVVRLLVDEYAKLDSEGYDPTGILPDIARNGYVDLVQFFFDKGVTLDNTSCIDNSIMHAAVESGNEKIVRMVLEKGADPDQKDYSYGTTALIKAIRKRDYAIVKMLLDNGAHPLVKDQRRDTAANMAALQGSDKVVRLLLERIEVEESLPLLEIALMRAAQGGSVEVILVLVENGLCRTPDISRKAIDHASRRGRTAVIKYFLDNGTDVRDCGYALHNAVSHGHADAVAFLLDKGADVHARNSEGKSLLDAFQYGHPDMIVHKILDAGVTVTDDNTRQPAVRSVLQRRGWKLKHSGMPVPDCPTSSGIMVVNWPSRTVSMSFQLKKGYHIPISFTSGNRAILHL